MLITTVTTRASGRQLSVVIWGVWSVDYNGHHTSEWAAVVRCDLGCVLAPLSNVVNVMSVHKYSPPRSKPSPNTNPNLVAVMPHETGG